VQATDTKGKAGFSAVSVAGSRYTRA
jgi:hypothetical protein